MAHLISEVIDLWEDDFVSTNTSRRKNTILQNPEQFSIQVETKTSEANISIDKKDEKKFCGFGYWNLEKFARSAVKGVCYVFLLGAVVHFSRDIVNKYKNEYTVTVTSYKQGCQNNYLKFIIFRRKKFEKKILNSVVGVFFLLLQRFCP